MIFCNAASIRAGELQGDVILKLLGLISDLEIFPRVANIWERIARAATILHPRIFSLRVMTNKLSTPAMSCVFSELSAFYQVQNWDRRIFCTQWISEIYGPVALTGTVGNAPGLVGTEKSTPWLLMERSSSAVSTRR